MVLDCCGRIKLTVERALICNIVHKQNPHSASIVCGGDGSEPFLSCRVPYLQLHPLAVEFNRADFEVNPYRGDERRREGILAEPKQTT